MSEPFAPLPLHQTRLGIHYFPDTLHYCDNDLQAWLPELKSLGMSWIVLRSPADRAIPEAFIEGLVKAGIEPLLEFRLPLSSPPEAADLETLLTAYSRWGVHGVIFFDRPNTRASWTSSSWAQQGLVERFLDRYLPFAEKALATGLTPIFPPLEPGGSYWDTAFLRYALESLIRRRQVKLLQNLVLSAYAWTADHPLSWGAGGPDRWPEARPYSANPSSQDQRGFRIFDWYLSISEAVLQIHPQMILLGAGLPSDPEQLDPRLFSPTQHAATDLMIARLLAGEKVSDPEIPETNLEIIPAQVIAGNFSLLSADAASPASSFAWFPADQPPLPIVEELRAWRSQPTPVDQITQPTVTKLRKDMLSEETVFDEDQEMTSDETPFQENVQEAAQEIEESTTEEIIAEPLSEVPEAVMQDDTLEATLSENSELPVTSGEVNQNGKDHPIKHYLLLPTYEWGIADWHLDVIRPFIRKYHPTVGFSLYEAALAKMVTVVGNDNNFPENELDHLRSTGCSVERISGDGISIATQLSER
jgi:hypothetical protein